MRVPKTPESGKRVKLASRVGCFDPLRPLIVVRPRAKSAEWLLMGQHYWLFDPLAVG